MKRNDSLSQPERQQSQRICASRESEEKAKFRPRVTGKPVYSFGKKKEKKKAVIEAMAAAA